MDPPPRFLAPLAALLLLSAAPGMAQFANFPAADRVLGAPNFTTPGTGSDDATGLDYPAGVAVDPTSGKIFVASGGQNRVLRYANLAALANGANAEAALGQPDLTTTTIGTSQTKMKSPYGVFVDGQGRLWVADTFNHRVLMFEGAATLSSGAPADLVLGQSTFVTDATAAGGSGMNTPVAVHVDADDDLWVADYFNRRVIGFLNVSSANNGDNAGCVIGQPDFMTTSPGSTDAKLTTPAGVVVDGSGSLWVSDQSNARVLRFDNAGSLPFGSVAAGVLGQTDFTSNTPGLGAQKFASPQGLAFDTAGNLLVTDLTNNRVLVFRNGANAANGAAAIAVIGQADFASNTASISSRQLNGPNFGIAADAAGGSGCRIREMIGSSTFPQTGRGRRCA